MYNACRVYLCFLTAVRRLKHALLANPYPCIIQTPELASLPAVLYRQEQRWISQVLKNISLIMPRLQAPLNRHNISCSAYFRYLKIAWLGLRWRYKPRPSDNLLSDRYHMDYHFYVCTHSIGIVRYLLFYLL